MRQILFITFITALVTFSAPAFAVFKCTANGKITYSDIPCSQGKVTSITLRDRKAPTPEEIAISNAQKENEKKQLTQLENQRHQREAKEEKEQQRAANAASAKRKKCDALALREKWSEEDAAAAAGKSVAKARKNARRATEKYEMECK